MKKKQQDQEPERQVVFLPTSVRRAMQDVAAIQGKLLSRVYLEACEQYINKAIRNGKK